MKTTQDLLQSIYNLNYSMIQKIDELNSKIEILEFKVDNISNNKTIILNNNQIIPFKKEKFDLNDDIVRKLLERTNIQGDYEMFKLMYLNTDKNLYPIKKTLNNDYQYWYNEGWNSDIDYIKSVLSSNLRHCYLKINIYDMYKENSDKFIKNQEHIDNLSDDKYLTKLIEYIYKKFN